MQTLQTTERRAILEVAPELLREGIGVLFDHGLQVIGSLNSDALLGRSVLLVIAGDALPEPCGEPGPLKQVIITITSESYGHQRLVRVTDIRVTTRTAADLSELAVGVRRLALQADDTVLVSVDRPLPMATIERIQEHVRAGLPSALQACVKVLVVDGGMDVTIVGKAA